MKQTGLVLALAAIATFTTTGCLRKDTLSSMYLRDDGSLDWVVSERNVRSDESDPIKSAKEESSYLKAVIKDEHDVAAIFRAFGGTNVRTRVLRDIRPYDVVTDAQFSSLSDLLGQMLTECDVPHRITQTADNGVTTLQFRADPDEHGKNATQRDIAECGLLDLSITLETGHFTNAVGFTIKGGDTVTFGERRMDSDDQSENQGPLEFSLSWTSRDPVS